MKTSPFVDYLVHDCFGDTELTSKFNFGGWTIFRDKKSFAIVIDDVFYLKAGTNNLDTLLQTGKKYHYLHKDGTPAYMNYISYPIEDIEVPARIELMNISLEAHDHPIKPTKRSKPKRLPKKR